MSTEEKENLGTILRQSAFPADMKADPLLSRENLFQAYYPVLDEAVAALDRAGQLLSAHLASVEPVIA